MQKLCRGFLRAVLGTAGAKALIKATDQAIELEAAIFPRTITAWLEALAPFGFEGVVPGTTNGFTLVKSEAGYQGQITLNNALHQFSGATLFYVAGCVAAALSLEPETLNPLTKSENLIRLGRSIDLLVKHAVVKAERDRLEKTSWNVKNRRRYQFDPVTNQPETNSNGPIPLRQDQVNKRREQYAQSVGLKPKFVPNSSFPNSGETNRLPYSGRFDLEHELGHALMTPDDNLLGQYQEWLSQDKFNVEPEDQDLSDPEDPDNEFEDERRQDAQDTFDEGGHHENVANAIEPYIERRSGVDPHMFQSKFRTIPKEADEQQDSGALDSRSGNVKTDPSPSPKGGTHKPFFNQDIRDEAKGHIQGFDQGKKFGPKGQVIQPKGVDVKINQRAQAKTLKAELKPNRVRLPSVKKAADKPNKRTDLSGPAAAPIAPTQPLQALPEQNRNQTQDVAGAAGTSNKTSVKLPSVKKPTASITKAESLNKCPTCGLGQFTKGQFTGCMCFSGLSKNGVNVSINSTGGYLLRFEKEWDVDSITTLLETLKKNE